jgi:uncharacterized protein
LIERKAAPLLPCILPVHCAGTTARSIRDTAAMSHTPHELHEEFPELAAKIHALKTADSQFAALADTYHDLNRAVHRMEAGIETVADDVLEEAKKKRLALKDQISALLARA